MGEIKSVKVDNWGVFFLQKLQNFFNKTDFCDLTLQFKDNSQLKVHRLVLSACTDFFNVLEQTCELMDDALVMPPELQADVVVPIVNFMYTGTLEFELRMYTKLLKTAKEMNMTVLLKLLEAHKRTMETSRSNLLRASSPKNKLKKPMFPPKSLNATLGMNTTQKRLTTGPIAMASRRVLRPGTSNNQISLIKTPVKLQKGPTRLDAHTESYEPPFDAISYESKPMKEEPEDYFEVRSTPPKKQSSPFEQLRKGFNNNKRPANATFISPPAKKPNIEDVKEFSEQQRMRKQIAAEFGDDAEFDNILDDEFHHDDDDEEPVGIPSSSTTIRQQSQTKQNTSPHASIIIKQAQNEKQTIVVKDSSNSKMDHAKIIEQVLRQYPHLVKSNKNIKLKIMPNASGGISSSGQTQKIIVKKETNEDLSPQAIAKQQLMGISKRIPSQTYPKTTTASIKIETDDSLVETTKATVVKSEVAVGTNTAPTKRRIDSKTMHSLIAKGAENTTGPWLCLRCGVNGRPISIPSYRGFRRHLINTHKEKIDPALCEHCGWRSTNNRNLQHHLQTEHNIESANYVFPKCQECGKYLLDPNDLRNHIEQYHPEHRKQQCIYCNKSFNKEMLLYNHIKVFHKKHAREDGIADFSEDESDELENATGDKKIKILSDISLPSTILKLEDAPSSIDEEYGNDSGPKFVNADGNEMLLTAEQREEIMSQLDQDHEGGVVMVLNESTFPSGTNEITQNEIKLESSENDEQQHDDFDEQMYNDFGTDGEAEYVTNDVSADEGTMETSNNDGEDKNEHQVSHEDDVHMEWAENLISAHDVDDDEQEDERMLEKDHETDDASKEETEKVSSSKRDTRESKAIKKDIKKEDDINLKLKMLTGDWSDDEIDEDEDEEYVDSGRDEIEKMEKETSKTSSEITDKSLSEDTHEKQKESFDNEEEAEVEDEEPKAAEEKASLEEEISQSSQHDNDDTQESHTEKVQQNQEDKEEEPVDEHEEEHEEHQEHEKPVNEKRKPSQENEEKALSPKSEGKVSRRTSSNKDESTEKQKEKEEKDSIDETKVKETNVSTNEDEKDISDTKSTTSEKAEDTLKSSKKSPERRSETPEKVKSLISEWADEEEEEEDDI